VTEQALRGLDGIMGPIGHGAYPRDDATWVMPPVRKKFDLFAAVRPSLSHAGIPSIHTVVDIVFLRELTEGMLCSETMVAGLPEFRPNDDITVAMRVITRKGSNRVAREAFEIARTRKRKKYRPSLRRRRRGAARPCVPWPHPAKRAHRCRGCGPAD
jgi:3-isopropylmalate dehydrogenase